VLWRTVVKHILAFSPSYTISQVLRLAGVDELRTAAMRFDRTRRVIASGGALDLVPRSVKLPPLHLIIEMVLIPGSSLIGYVDQHGAVRMAGVTTGVIVNTWRSQNPIRKIHFATLLLWESPLHGLVMVIYGQLSRCVRISSSLSHLLRAHSVHDPDIDTDMIWFLKLKTDSGDPTSSLISPLIIDPRCH
jgi:hypothetical protein